MQIVLLIFGVIVMLAGAYFGIFEGIIEPNQKGHSFGSGDKIELVLGFALIYLGLIGIVLSSVFDKVSEVFDKLNEQVKTPKPSANSSKAINRNSIAENRNKMNRKKADMIAEKWVKGICPECGKGVDPERSKCFSCNFEL